MHDLGVIAEQARGWRFQLADQVPSPRWNRRRFNDRGWALGAAPFHFNREFREQLKAHVAPTQAEFAFNRNPKLYFRYDFRLDSDLLRPDSQFKMEVVSTDSEIAVWVNGREVQSEKPKKNKREYWIPPQPAAGEGGRAKAGDFFRAGRNVIAVQVTARSESSDPLLQLRLDEVRRPRGEAEEAKEAVEVKQVTERAVVCDLCSGQYGQVPACVNACPHEAAMRVDARFDFPAQ
jgi:hypothetical protein